MNKEKLALPLSGWLMIPVSILYPIAIGYLWYIFANYAGNTLEGMEIIMLLGMILLSTLWVLILCGFFYVEPNGSKVMLLFGKYIGTVKDDGPWWANPFFSKRAISLRARTLNGEKIKVNDSMGNPIEIAAVIVWQVKDTYEASFEVDDYEQYVTFQSETAVRHLASVHPYDAEDSTISLRKNTDEIASDLQIELQERLSRAGVNVLEARLSHLAYSSEIAGAMLRRQQASAIIAARQKIVEGAVSMVEMALQKLEEGGKVKLDDERRAAMVSNLMVVLCGDHSAQPVVNTGTLYP